MNMLTELLMVLVGLFFPAAILAGIGFALMYAPILLVPIGAIICAVFFNLGKASEKEED